MQFRRARFLRYALLSLMTVLFVGCGVGSDVAKVDPTVGAPRKVGSLEINATTDKATYVNTDTVVLTTTIRNIGGSVMTIATVDPLTFVDITGTNFRTTLPTTSDNANVTYTLQPNATRTFSQTFQTSTFTVKTGRYVLQSYLAAATITMGGLAQDYPGGDIAANAIAITTTAP